MRQRLTRRNGRQAYFEVLIGQKIVWRGRRLERVLPTLSKRHRRAKLTIRWVPGPELLVVVETL